MMVKNEGISGENVCALTQIIIFNLPAGSQEIYENSHLASTFFRNICTMK
jgi:hypothetical protein